MDEKLESVKRAVCFGITNGKKNMIVDLDVLAALFQARDDLALMNRKVAHGCTDANCCICDS